MTHIPRNLRGLTLYPTTDNQWQASVKVSTDGWSVHIANTPEEAIEKAVGRWDWPDREVSGGEPVVLTDREDDDGFDLDEMLA